MSSDKHVPLFAVVEALEPNLCRAQLLPPLSLAVVANDWTGAKKLLSRSLKKHIRSCSPAHWAQVRPMQMPESR
ncbi:MAG: hypothetical protein ABL921_27485, partial [Pirellula sp.]